MAVLCSRKMKDRYGTRPNVYVLATSISSSGKDHPRKVVKDILNQSQGQSLFGPEGFASSAGLLQSVKNSPSILFQIDEIGRMMVVIRDGGSPHLYKIGGEMLKLYSSSNTIYKGEAHADSKHDVVIPFPCASVFGTHTPELFDAVTTENVREGLLGRFMLFQGRGFVSSKRVPEALPPEKITDWAKRWTGFPPLANLPETECSAKIVEYDAGAEARFQEHIVGIETKRLAEQESAAILWSRTAEKTAKLALLFACSRVFDPKTETAVVTKDDVDLAVLISNYTTRLMIFNVAERVSENKTEATSKRLLRFVSGNRNSPTTKRAISRAFRGLDNRTIDDNLSTLLSAGLIEQVKVKTGGRPTFAYFRP